MPPLLHRQTRFVDTARRVEKFQERAEKITAAKAVRKGKRVKKAAAKKKRVASSEGGSASSGEAKA